VGFCLDGVGWLGWECMVVRMESLLNTQQVSRGICITICYITGASRGRELFGDGNIAEENIIFSFDLWRNLYRDDWVAFYGVKFTH
jgi:hypothetical protein